MPIKDWHLDQEELPPGEDLPADDYYTPGEEIPKRRRLRRLLALMCLFAFLGLILANLNSLWGDLPPYLEQFQSLSSQELVKSSQPAVVKILAYNSSGGTTSPRQGTGFNIDPRGLIVTNRHLLDNCQEVRLSFADGRTFSSKQFKTIGNWDLALVHLDAQKLPVLEPDYSRQPVAGELLTIIGNPEGFKNIPARGPLAGYVNAEGSKLNLMLIQASIGPGNSGSPVMDGRGKVVGVVFAMTGEGQDSQALAIPLAALSNELSWASF